MTTRTIESRVVFRHPFRLPGVCGLQPPGTYALTTDQEELCGVSFITYRNVAVFLRLPAIGTVSLEVREVPINLDDLDAGLRADRAVPVPCVLFAPHSS